MSVFPSLVFKYIYNYIKITVQSDIKIKSHNAVYSIKCERCDRVVYLGETERIVSERLKNYTTFKK